MHVLLLGATGNLGSRLIPALVTHSHTLTVYIRSSSKLRSLLPDSVFSRLTIIEGDATSTPQILSAILSSQADAIVNVAGVAALAPWGSSTLPQIFSAVLEAVKQAGSERQRPLRVWFLGGTGVLNIPGTNTQLSSYVPIFLAHRRNLALLRSLPPSSVDWSMLCPMTMLPESTDFSVPAKPSPHGKLIANAGTPPLWKTFWFDRIPLIGRVLSVAMNASRYDTTLEQNAEFIAEDLETRESRWIGEAVGIIDPSKQ